MIQKSELRNMNTQAEKLNFLNFSSRLTKLMASSGKTQKELAAILGVSEGTMINWKRGQLPKGEELWGLSRCFGVSMEWLLTGEGSANEPSHGVAENGQAPYGTASWQDRALAAEQRLAELHSEISATLKKFSP
jgi:transcriptional regulator with XRE-family HTH domain